MVHQMVQQGALWPNIMYGKIWATLVQNQASIVTAVLDVGTKMHNNVTWLEQLKCMGSAIARPEPIWYKLHSKSVYFMHSWLASSYRHMHMQYVNV